MLRRATGLMLDSANVTPLDGRVARSRRTRAAIVEALVSLLEEGNPQPTVEEIAARASVAPRTVFQHYADREALFAAVSEHREAHLRELMGQIDPAAPLEVRIDEIVAQRARVFEWIAAVRRGALLMEPFSESVHAALEGFRAEKRAELERVFAGEIAARDDGGERAALVAALGVAGSWSSWDALRSQQGLDVEDAVAALRLTLRGLLGSC
jgi:TetR/AcrR family transcriptional regulator, regulator of autoinduction and epiphytic fitness